MSIHDNSSTTPPAEWQQYLNSIDEQPSNGDISMADAMRSRIEQQKQTIARLEKENAQLRRTHGIQDNDDQREVIFETATTKGARPIKFVWYPKFPRGYITLLGGDPGTGKTTAALDIAAKITAGVYGKPELVFVISGEEDNNIITARIHAAGGNPDLVRIYKSVTTSAGKHELLQMTRDHVPLAAAMQKSSDETGLSIGMVIVDPIDGFAGELNMNRSNHVRTMMTPMGGIAESFHCVFAVLIHLNKQGNDQSPIYRFLGSIATVGFARVCHLTIRDPDDPGLCYFAPAKANIVFDNSTYPYRMETVSYANDDDQMELVPAELSDHNKHIQTNRIVWSEYPLDMNAKALTESFANRGKAARGQASPLRDQIIELLKTRGKMRSAEIAETLDAMPTSVNKVLRKLRALPDTEPKAEKGMDGKWRWIHPAGTFAIPE